MTGRYPRNDALVRVLALLRLLEQRGRHTLGDLAARFSVHPRTMRRDLQALQDAGWPLGHEERDELRSVAQSRPGTWWLA